MDFNFINNFNKSSYIIFAELATIKFKKWEDVDLVIKGLEYYAKNLIVPYELLKFRNVIPLKISQEFPQLFVSEVERDQFNLGVACSVVAVLNKLKEIRESKTDFISDNFEQYRARNTLRKEFDAKYINKIPENSKEFLFLILQLLNQIGNVKVCCFENISEEKCLEILKNLDICNYFIEKGVDINEILSLSLPTLQKIFSYSEELGCFLDNGISLSEIDKLALDEKHLSSVATVRFLCENKSLIKDLSQLSIQMQELIFDHIDGIFILSDKISLEQMFNFDFDILKSLLQNAFAIEGLIDSGANLQQILKLLNLPNSNRMDVLLEKSTYVVSFLKRGVTLDDFINLSEKEFNCLWKYEYPFSYNKYLEKGIDLKQLANLNEILDNNQFAKFDRLNGILSLDGKHDMKSVFMYFLSKDKETLSLLMENIEIIWNAVMRGIPFVKAEEMVLKIFREKGNY